LASALEDNCLKIPADIGFFIFNRDCPLSVPSGLFECKRTIIGVFPVFSSCIARYSLVSEPKIHAKNSLAIISNPKGQSRFNRLLHRHGGSEKSVRRRYKLHLALERLNERISGIFVEAKQKP